MVEAAPSNLSSEEPANYPNWQLGRNMGSLILAQGVLPLLVGLSIYWFSSVGVPAEFDACKAEIRTLEANLIESKGSIPNEEHRLIDPWGHAYQYLNPGKHNANGYDIYSMGLDGVDGSDDDIGNWTP